MKIGYFKLERLGDNGKVLRHDLICTQCGQIINIDDFVRDNYVQVWTKQVRSDLWRWIGEQGFHCEHYLKWRWEEKYWDYDFRQHQRESA